MYVGHFAAGLAIKAKEPDAPTWALLVGVGVLDILFGPFVLAGIERATVTPSLSPGFSLDYIDWSHSLLMSLVWSVLFAAAFARHGRRVMLALGFAVFSHFLLDLPMHPPDLALWPNSASHVGLGLWRPFPPVGGSSSLPSLRRYGRTTGGGQHPIHRSEDAPSRLRAC